MKAVIRNRWLAIWIQCITRCCLGERCVSVRVGVCRGR